MQDGRVGVLGGAFNPPHLGHLVLAQEAFWQLGLDRVVFVPTGEPPHKSIEADPGAEVRLEMTRLATTADSRFDVSRAELDREGPSYTCDTLEALDGGSTGEGLVLLMGADAALGFGEWSRPERILELAELGVARRPGVGSEELREALDGAGAGERATVVEMPELHVASSEVRARVVAGRPIRYLVPETVAALIAEQGLYAA